MILTERADLEMGKYLLIVEDDESVAEGLTDILTGYHFQVARTENMKETVALLKKGNVDLIIMDVYLDGENGYEVCRKIRETWDVPILFLTGCSSEMELIRGFKSGGDDYVTKPFRMQELIVRIQALLKRSANHKNPLRKSGELIYDEDRKMMLIGEAKLDLTVTELKIVEKLLENWPRTVTREGLLYDVWDLEGDYVAKNTLNVNISRLRDKLGNFEGRTYIATVRGVGYRWAIPVRR